MKPENPQAFPQSISPGGPFGGMTLRDWFAGQVASGYLAGVIIDGDTGCALAEPEVLAARFGRIADAMLAERECDR
ncbi:MAG: hypothetical protein MK060_15665 [Blastomonas sp.]|uniref:hypothetical protein n=1 Tax=Blastomonas sp. TaxID=1909299 RepID=UPI00406A1E73|nr:hypothetical protein [Blastomonas sp.]